ncbi:MAG: molybdopterin-binding protein [Syntrophobacterales bacterium]|nr:molybdopterin-binding protein [Syntrophobacterales bacterium]
MEFLKVLSISEVINLIGSFPKLDIEVVPIEEALGRVLAENIYAPEPVPHFRRATMDGYAVRARDTFGASESMPALLEIVGSVEMGKAPTCVIGPNQAASIPTGGAVPDGADAVVMVEYTTLIDESTIEVYRPVAPGDHIMAPGEDISEGSLLFEAGRILKPQDIGTLAGLGITEVRVHRKPRVGIISTGDEIVDHATKGPLPVGSVRNVNSFFIAGLCQEVGAQVGMGTLISDNKEILHEACINSAKYNDVVILSGGSSVGIRDFTLRVFQELPESRILFHGVAIKPGKPTILATNNKTYFWGLPGQPTSALIVMFALVCPFLLAIQGVNPSFPFSKAVIEANLASRVPSVHGREDYVPVKLVKQGDKWVARPIFGKSGMISLLTKADGFITIPEHTEGFEEGSIVIVNLI